jgi:protein-arginine kinase activator protein McsA
MLCDKCNKREALVHLGSNKEHEDADSESGVEWEQHFCKDCADEYYAQTPGMNSSRDLIRLSDWYRSKLYDLLESECPGAFDYSDTEACERGSKYTKEFLRKQLNTDGIELNEDGFEMLWCDLNCSCHFYQRADEVNKRKG